MKRRFFRDANYLYRLYLNDRINVPDRLARLPEAHNRKRNLSLKLEALINGFLSRENRTYSENERRDYIKDLLRRVIIQAKIELESLPVIESTGCLVGITLYNYDVDRRKFNTSIPVETCTGGERTCRIRGFIENHAEDIRVINDLLSEDNNIRDNDRTVIEELNGILANTDTLPNKDFCKKCGDAIIALEQPDDSILLNCDKIFEKICPKLGKPQIYFS